MAPSPSLSFPLCASVSLSHIRIPVLQEDTFKPQHLFYLEGQEGVIYQDPQGLHRYHWRGLQRPCVGCEMLDAA